MKIVSIIMISSIIFYYGCSSTHMIRNKLMDKKDQFYGLGEEYATIKLTDSRELEGEKLLIAIDSVFYRSPYSKITLTVPTLNISEIIVKKYNRGAMEGLGIGVLSGFTLGALIGYFSYNPDEHGWFMPDSYSEAIFLYGAGYGVFIGLTGGLIGGIAGHTDRYIINEQQITSQKRKYMKIEVNSIKYEHDSSALVIYQNRKIQFARSQIKQIDNTGEKILITIPMHIYEEKFH